MFVKQLREQFYAAVAQKTGWGKEELKLEFERCLSDALARVLADVVAEEGP